MTEAEINLAIAKIEYPRNDIELVHDNLARVYKLSGYIMDDFDYCTDWDQIGPIIEREKIGLYPDASDSTWIAFRDDVEARAETPTKAAALCYLKMRESE